MVICILDLAHSIRLASIIGVSCEIWAQSWQGEGYGVCYFSVAPWWLCGSSAIVSSESHSSYSTSLGLDIGVVSPNK